MGIAAAVALSAAPVYAGTDSMTAEELIGLNYGHLQDLDVYYEIDAIMGSGSSQLENHMEMNMKAENIHAADKLKLYFQSRMTFLGQEQITETYYENGYAYSDTMGKKVRFPQEVSEASVYVDSLTSLMNPKQELYSSTSVSREGDFTLVAFQIAEEQLETVKDSLLHMLQVSQRGRKFETRAVSGQYWINPKGYVTKIQISASMNMISGEEAQELKMEADIRIDQPGQQIEIRMPDPSAYQETEG